MVLTEIQESAVVEWITSVIALTKNGLDRSPEASHVFIVVADQVSPAGTVKRSYEGFQGG